MSDIKRTQARHCRHLKQGTGVWVLCCILCSYLLPSCRQEEVRLAQRLRLHCQQCLGEAGPKRETAGVLLGRLLVRSDCRTSLRCFVTWATVQLQCTAPVAVFLVPGVCTSLPFSICQHASP